MMTRSIGVLALSLLAAGCALEQGDPVVDAPGTSSAAQTGGGVSGGGAHTPAVGQSNGAPVVNEGNGGPKFIPSTQADPCDPDPQPWRGNCPRGPTGSGDIKRDPLYLTPPQ